jgi:hypothetical protein
MNNNPTPDAQAAAPNQPTLPSPQPSAGQASDSQSINDYIDGQVGITRASLNIKAFIGVFIFGWLMKMNYDDLGERGLGTVFLILMIGCLVLAKQVEPMLGVVALIIYAGAWIHTNVILSEKQRTAREEYLRQRA